MPKSMNHQPTSRKATKRRLINHTMMNLSRKKRPPTSRASCSKSWKCQSHRKTCSPSVIKPILPIVLSSLKKCSQQSTTSIKAKKINRTSLPQAWHQLFQRKTFSRRRSPSQTSHCSLKINRLPKSLSRWLRPSLWLKKLKLMCNMFRQTSVRSNKLFKMLGL
jgi:hypothetical protein